MNTIEQIRSKIEKAHEIRQSRAAAYREFQDRYTPELARVQRLFKGNSAAVDIFERQQLRQLFREIQSTTKTYRETLSAAKKEAEDLIHTSAAAPDRELVDRFEKRLDELRTEILIAPTAETASQRLRDFVSGINDPYFAMRIKQEYGSLAAPIIESAGSQAGKFKVELSQSFEQLKTSALTPEQLEAVELLETSEALMNARLHSQLIEDRISGTFGHRAAAFVSDPDSFFSAPHMEQDEARISSEEQQLAMAMQIAEIRRDNDDRMMR